MLDHLSPHSSSLLPSLQTLSHVFTALDAVLILASFSGMFLAKNIVNRFSHKTAAPKKALRVAGIRGVCLATISILMYVEVPSAMSQQYGLVKVLSIIASIYLCYLGNFISAYFIFKRFGKSRTLGDTVITIPTYQTRALSLLCSLLFIIIAVVAIVQQLGFSNLLEAGGVIGVVGVMLALTQASWAPDIISGLILLNSDMIEEGDVLELPNGTIAEVFKTKMFHTELLDITQNNRIMVRNTALRDHTLRNLSRFASNKGLRHCIPFNIDYLVSIADVEALFEDVKANAMREGLAFEPEQGVEATLLETGDHALQWGLIFYTKAPDKLIETKRRFIRLTQIAAQQRHISLATPLTHTMVLAQPSAPTTPPTEHSTLQNSNR